MGKIRAEVAHFPVHRVTAGNKQDNEKVVVNPDAGSFSATSCLMQTITAQGLKMDLRGFEKPSFPPENPHIIQVGGTISGTNRQKTLLDEAAKLVARALLDFGSTGLVEAWRQSSLEIKEEVYELLLRFTKKG